jgi:hypothetical protein
MSTRRNNRRRPRRQTIVEELEDEVSNLPDLDTQPKTYEEGTILFKEDGDEVTLDEDKLIDLDHFPIGRNRTLRILYLLEPDQVDEFHDEVQLYTSMFVRELELLETNRHFYTEAQYNTMRDNIFHDARHPQQPRRTVPPQEPLRPRNIIAQPAGGMKKKSKRNTKKRNTQKLKCKLKCKKG